MSDLCVNFFRAGKSKKHRNGFLSNLISRDVFILFVFLFCGICFFPQELSAQEFSYSDYDESHLIFDSEFSLETPQERVFPASIDSRTDEITSDSKEPKRHSASHAGIGMQDPETVFKEALALFEKADRLPESMPHTNDSDLETIRMRELRKSEFRKTAALYQGLVHRGIESGYIFYNQGNAWYRAGETARAIASYRQAERYLPSNPYLASNLKAISNGENPAHRSRFATLFFWQNRISYPVKFQSAAVLSAVTFLAGLWALFARKKTIFVVAAFLGLLAVVMIFTAGVDWFRFSRTRYGVIGVEQTLLRTGNSEQYEPSLTEPILKNTEFTVLDQRGNWIRIELQNNENGWIPKQDAYVY